MESCRRPNKKRIEAVFKHQMPDRVPNFEVLVDNPTLSYIMGREIEGGHTLNNIDPKDYSEFVKKIGQDVIGMCFYDNPFRYYDASGNKKRLDYNIKTQNDLDRLLPLNLEHLEERFKLLDEYQQAVKDTDIGLFVLTGSFFCDAYSSIFGFDNFMYLLYDDRDLVEEILERYTQFYVAVAERLVQYDLTFFYVGDDIAFKSGTLIHPKLIRELWVPRISRIMEPARKKGIPILFHSDGNIIEVLPDIIEMGVSAINPLEPYGMDILEVKRRFGKELALVGNLDVGASLSRGTPGDVRRDAEQLIDAVGRDGGLILASSHSITPNVKPENFLAMVDTAQTYGVL